MTGRPHDFAEVPAPGPWTDRAACKGYTRLFFADNHVPALCRELCGTCPVKAECLDYAVEFQVHGVWAGTSWRERQILRRRRRVA